VLTSCRGHPVATKRSDAAEALPQGGWLAVPRFPFLPANERFYDLLHASAKNLADAGEVLADFMEHYQNVEMKTDRMRELEHQGDAITHEITALLHKTFVTPIDREDIARLADRLDDVLDYVEEATAAMKIYEVSGPTPRSVEMADIVRLMTIKVEEAISRLRDRRRLRDILPYCVEINRLENVADDLFRKAMAELFQSDSTSTEIIKWRDIYRELEAATDRCEDVANVLEGIVLRNA
jgi:predicted phosphate transport protein (TIGR00153 family)